MSGNGNRARSGWWYRAFAWILAKGSPRYERLIESHKRDLFGNLTGAVLEIGPGTGINFKYFPKDIRWIGIEPNVHMHGYLREEARKHGLPAEVRTGIAEDLAIGDASVDAVVSSLVLCSVDDLTKALQEIRRVLKPGGSFYFIEHVAAPRRTLQRRIQRFVRPIWKLVGDGCHPDREIWAGLEKAGFSHLNYDRFTVPVPVISPHIAGHAITRRNRKP